MTDESQQGKASLAADISVWLNLIARSRLKNRSSTLYTSRDPFSAAAYWFYRTNRRAIQDLGIHRLYLRTRYGKMQKLYSLTDSGGHLFEETGDVPNLHNYQRIFSKSAVVYNAIQGTDVPVRAQIVAYTEPSGTPYFEAVKAFTNYLLGEFITYEKDVYYRGLELGSAETDRLAGRYGSGGILPGTYGALLVRRLARSTSAKACLFCIHQGSRVYAEYANINLKRYKHRPIVLNGICLTIGDGVRAARIEVALKEQEFVGLGIGDPAVKKIIDEINERVLYASDVSLTNSSIWIVPIRHDSDVIASFMFMFEPGSYGYSNAAHSLVSRGVRDFGQAARYLYQRRVRQLIVDPMFKSRDTRVEAGRCFLMMPFGEGWSEAVADVVKEVMADLNVEVIRADEMFGENIMEDVWNAILSSEYIVADVTGKNPNVYYELGIAHTIGKRTILLSQNASDIPFDTQHLRHVIYSNDITGFNSIRKGIRGFAKRQDEG